MLDPQEASGTMAEIESDDQDTVLYRAAGQGVFAGLLAAVASHWLWGINLLALVFFYAFGVAKLRGWAEQAAIITLIGTTVAYTAITEVLGLPTAEPSLKVGLIGLAVVLFLVYAFGAAALVNRARVRAFQNAAMNTVDVSRSQHWEEPYYSALRARLASGTSLRPLVIAPLAWIALAGLIAIWSDNRLLEAVLWGVAFYQTIVFGRLAQYAKRIQQPSAQSVLERASRPPILFLRPFALDALPVSSMGEDNPFELRYIISWLDKRTFEEHLSSAFEELGPMIAIGRPGEEVPPLGAAREYANDASWKALVLDRASASQFVIMEVDATKGMEWEIANVVKSVGLRRILIVLPPGADLYEPRSVDWYQRWTGLRARFDFLPDVSEASAAVLFDGAGRAVIVPADARSVPRTLEGIKRAWVEARGPFAVASGTTGPRPPDPVIAGPARGSSRRRRRRDAGRSEP
jgi:hypothetical protein